MKNADKKLRKGDSCFETGILKSKNAQLLHEAVQPQNENNHPINDNGKRLTRELVYTCISYKFYLFIFNVVAWNICLINIGLSYLLESLVAYLITGDGLQLGFS